MTSVEVQCRHRLADYLMETARREVDPVRRGRRILLAVRIERRCPVTRPTHLQR